MLLYFKGVNLYFHLYIYSINRKIYFVLLSVRIIMYIRTTNVERTFAEIEIEIYKLAGGLIKFARPNPKSSGFDDLFHQQKNEIQPEREVGDKRRSRKRV